MQSRHSQRSVPDDFAGCGVVPDQAPIVPINQVGVAGRQLDGPQSAGIGDRLRLRWIGVAESKLLDRVLGEQAALIQVERMSGCLAGVDGDFERSG